MEFNKRNVITLIALLTLLVIVTTVFVVAFTFAGNPESPDAVATYTRNKIRWNIPSDESGIAQLNIFGEPEEGEEYPLIHPYSQDTYYLRLRNEVYGEIEYTVFFYTENENIIPLKFDVTMDEGMSETSEKDIPYSIKDKQIVASFTGDIEGNSLKDFQIDWYWDTDTDNQDTDLGVMAASMEMTYPINVLIIVDDRNGYTSSAVTKPNKDEEEEVEKPDPMETGSLEGVYERKLYVTGYPDDSFKPQNNMTRAEVSAIFARILAEFDEAAITGTSTSFEDVLPGDWFNRYIAELEGDGIIEGYSDGSFKPDMHITRAEFATVAVRFLESRIGEIRGEKTDYSDIENSHWATEYINKATAKGLVKGYPDGTFRPDSFITRAEVVTVINRLLVRMPDRETIDKEITAKKLITFADIDKSHWAYYEIIEAANDWLER